MRHQVRPGDAEVNFCAVTKSGHGLFTRPTGGDRGSHRVGPEMKRRAPLRVLASPTDYSVTLSAAGTDYFFLKMRRQPAAASCRAPAFLRTFFRRRIQSRELNFFMKRPKPFRPATFYRSLQLGHDVSWQVLAAPQYRANDAEFRQFAFTQCRDLRIHGSRSALVTPSTRIFDSKPALMWMPLNAKATFLAAIALRALEPPLNGIGWCLMPSVFRNK